MCLHEKKNVHAMNFELTIRDGLAIQSAHLRGNFPGSIASEDDHWLFWDDLIITDGYKWITDSSSYTSKKYIWV